MTFTVQGLGLVASVTLDASARFVLAASPPLAWTVGRPWPQVRANLEYRKRLTVEPGSMPGRSALPPPCEQ